MSAMSDAVKNGPRMAAARTASIEARIKLAEAKGKKAHDQAAGLRRRAKGDGPLAKSRQLRAAALQSAADRHRAAANQLRTDLAKAKDAEAARHVKHVKRTVASTAAEGLSPVGQAGPPSRAKAGQTKPSGRRRGQKVSQQEIEFAQERHHRNHNAMVAREEKRHAKDHPATTKGTPAMTTVSGEAVNIEQTRANLDQLKGQVADLRGSFEGISGSLASGGLNQLAGSIASADDSLDSVLTDLTAAEKHLSDQEAIAEAAQAAGEMHGDKSFYGA